MAFKLTRIKKLTRSIRRQEEQFSGLMNSNEGVDDVAAYLWIDFVGSDDSLPITNDFTCWVNQTKCFDSMPLICEWTTYSELLLLRLLRKQKRFLRRGVALSLTNLLNWNDYISTRNTEWSLKSYQRHCVHKLPLLISTNCYLVNITSNLNALFINDFEWQTRTFCIAHKLSNQTAEHVQSHNLISLQT